MAQYNIFNIYDIMSSKVGDANNNNSMSHQIGTITTATGNANQPGDVYQKDTQVWIMVGVTSMPANPTGNTDAAQSVSISMSDTDVIIGTRDTRFQSFISDIQPGDVYIYATGPSAKAGIKVKAGTNEITATAGGNSDFVAIGSLVNSMFTSLITKIGSNLTSPSGAVSWVTPPTVDNNPTTGIGTAQGTVLKADKP